MAESKIRINAGEGYDVTIAQGILPHCGEIISATIAHCKAAIITDSNVEKLYLDTLRQSLENSGFSTCAFAFPAGEESKNLNTLADILNFLAENEITRSDLIVALGGGVVGDIAGFASGVYLRGIRLVQIPTTLLAAVDSSVGGKTAVDIRAGKNLAGVFKQPNAVICDTECLSTLTPEIFSDGAAETIKYGVIADVGLFETISGGIDSSALSQIIARCVEIKGGVVERDEFEKGERKILNYGHTIAHAIEKLSGYEVSHGKAVAMGMVAMARAGESLGFTELGTAEKITAAVKNSKLPTAIPYSANELAKAALSDKKRSGGNISLVYPERIGRCRIVETPVSELESIIRIGTEH